MLRNMSATTRGPSMVTRSRLGYRPNRSLACSKTATLGGSFGKCLEAECGADYDDILARMDPLLQTGACDEDLAGCGVDF